MHANKTSRIIFLVVLIITACALLFGNNDPTQCWLLCEA